MGELAEHLSVEIPKQLTSSDLSEWKKIATAIEASDLESALLRRPPTTKVEEAIASTTASLIAEREREVVREVFEGVRELPLTRLLRHIIRSDSGIPIVTTNYDRLIEIAAEESGLGVDTMFSGRYIRVLDEKESRLSFCRRVSLSKGKKGKLHYRPRILIYKPHGSIDWYHRNGVPIQFFGDTTGASPLIITPGKNKYRNGYDSPFDRHRDRANSAIDRASRFLIIGYGFNDNHLETHLLTEIRNGKPTLLLTRSLSEKATELATKNPNVVALAKTSRNGADGTQALIEGQSHFIDNLALWDLNSFVTEVLEP